MAVPADPKAPKLNPALDRERLKAVYATQTRVHVPAVMTPESASRVHRCLAQDTVYNLVVNSGEKVFDLPPPELAKMSPAQRLGLTEAAGRGAQTGFQFLYDNHRVTESGEPYRDASHGLAAIAAFLNSEEFLGFARDVTGHDEIAFADAQATRYGPGHFLTTHDDDVSGKNRVAAYVLNMTPDWRADWGGLLLFLDQDDRIGGGFPPAFNALNILSVPQRHLVSQVSSFAPAHRYSITGWFRRR